MKKSSIVLIIVVLIVTVVGVFFLTPDYLGNKFRPWRLGLDLVGGSHLVYEVDLSEVSLTDKDIVMNGLRDVIERRVNLFGVSEPQVVTAKAGDSNRIIVELAGIKDISEAISQIGETPFLLFAEVAEVNLPISLEIEGEAQIEQAGGQQFIPTELTGRYIQGAQMNINDVTRKPEIFLEFTSEGADLFEDLTARNVGKQIGVFLDGALITAPVVNEVITGGQAQITGQFTLDEARALVERFNAGALPAPITLISQQTVGATLGTDSLSRTLKAGIFGTILVIIFMLMYYKKFGIFSSVALIMYIILLLGLFKLLGITLTLAGIAGVILTIGMAVDANILIFERVKEELKRGVNKTLAIQEGFRRAWPSIRDSNLTTIITAIILYTFTSSFVKGFALALLLGVIVSMFSAITITKNLLKIFIKEKA